MKWKIPTIALAFATAAAAANAQQSAAANPQSSDGSAQTMTTQTTKTTTVIGSVVRYTPGQTIVIRSSDGRTTTYTIGTAVQVPAEVQVGKRVTISSEPASDGSGMATVTHIETTSVNAQGQTKTTSERTEFSPSGQTSKTTTTTVYGTVTAFEPGQTITIERPSHETVTYTIDTETQLPKDLIVGKTVTVRTTKVSSSSMPVARQVTYRTVTRTSRSRSLTPQ